MKNKKISIHIEGLRLRTIIGFSEWERKKLQDIVIHIKYNYNAADAIETDNPEYCVDYKKLVKKIIQEVEASTFNLIETLSHRIHEIVSTVRNIDNVQVVVEKPHALRFCDNVIATVGDK